MKGFVSKTPIKADKNGNVPTTINLLKAGSWNTPWHGDFELTGEDLEEMANNFGEGVGLVVEDQPRAPVNEGHNAGGKATGWMTRLFVKAVNGTTGLFADVEWTPAGEQAIRDNEYAYISPEFNPRGWPWEDPEQEFTFVDNVLTGAALTNIPLFKKLKPITASRIPPSKVAASQAGEGDKHNQGEPMKLEDIRAKEVADLTDEEKTFLGEHKTELNDEERTKFELVDTDADADAKAKADKEAADKAAAEQAARDQAAADAQATEEAAKVEASAKGGVKISASELATLKADAEAGRQAKAELEQKKAQDIVGAAVKAGQIKSDDGKKWVGQLLKASSISADHRKETEELIAGLPKNETLGKELGDVGKDVEVTAELDKRASEIVASSNGQTTYSQATKQLLASDKDLRERVNADRTNKDNR